MSELLSKVQQARVKYRGDKAMVQAYNILTLLVGELETASTRDRSEITDEKVVVAIKKLIKSNKETLKLIDQTKTPEKVVDLVQQNVCLEYFLPVQLSEEQIRSEVQFRHATIPYTSIGEVIKELSLAFPGHVDKGLASKVAKELF